MAVLEHPPRLGHPPEEYPHAQNVGPIGRIGRYTATHFRVVLVGWLVVAIGLGFFAPKVETALSGAGWETTGSQSVQARNLIDKNFQGLSSYALMTVIYSPTKTVNDPAFKTAVANVERTLRADSGRQVGCPAGTGRLDFQRRPHRDRPGRRGEELKRHGEGRRCHQGQAREALNGGGAGPPDRRLRHVV